MLRSIDDHGLKCACRVPVIGVILRRRPVIGLTAALNGVRVAFGRMRDAVNSVERCVPKYLLKPRPQPFSLRMSVPRAPVLTVPLRLRLFVLKEARSANARKSRSGWRRPR